MRLAIVLDLLKDINVKKDTSLALAYAAKQRGCEVYLIEYNQVFLKDGEVQAAAQRVESIDERLQGLIAGTKIELKDYVQLSSRMTLTADDLDIVLMRKDPPLDQAYWGLTYLLQFWESAGVLVANSTRVLREYNEKCSILRFPALIADTVVTANARIIEIFLRKRGAVVIKPLNGMGGEGIIKLEADASDCKEQILAATDQGHLPVMVQQVLDIYREGDKRILIFHGQPLPYVLQRMPAQGEFRANLAAGGSGEVVRLTERDRELAMTVARQLPIDEMGLIGLDVIDGCISEINVTSPTCLREIQQYSGENYALDYVDGLLARF